VESIKSPALPNSELSLEKQVKFSSSPAEGLSDTKPQCHSDIRGVPSTFGGINRRLAVPAPHHRLQDIDHSVFPYTNLIIRGRTLSQWTKLFRDTRYVATDENSITVPRPRRV
jgi:hypothetical protein